MQSEHEIKSIALKQTDMKQRYAKLYHEMLIWEEDYPESSESENNMKEGLKDGFTKTDTEKKQHKT